jgi:hypothetical protein
MLSTIVAEAMHNSRAQKPVKVSDVINLKSRDVPVTGDTPATKALL